MSCCCPTPSAAALGSAILVLLLDGPSLFYSIMTLAFDYEDLANPRLRILTVVALGFAVLAAVGGILGRSTRRVGWLEGASGTGLLSFFLAIASIVWSGVAGVENTNSTEAAVVGVGTLLILGIPLFLAPIAWLSYETHALSRQLSGRKPLLAHPEAGMSPLLPPETGAASMPLSLAKAVPLGRSRRGRGARWEYEHASWSESEGGSPVTSSDEGEGVEASRARKGKMRATR